MTDPVRIDLRDVRRALEVLLAHVESAGTGEVELAHDYFWSVPPRQTYEVYAAPPEPTIGQLSESWQHVQTMLRNGDQVVGYGLVWLADVLRAIGEQNMA